METERQREDSHAKTEAEVGGMDLQAKECPQPLKAGTEADFPSEPLEGINTTDTLILNSPEL